MSVLQNILRSNHRRCSSVVYKTRLTELLRNVFFLIGLYLWIKQYNISFALNRDVMQFLKEYLIPIQLNFQEWWAIHEGIFNSKLALF